MNENRKKPTIGITCSYIPSNFLVSLGINVIPFSVANGKKNDKCTCRKFPTTICCYVHYIIDLIENSNLDGIILTNCCNSMQRLYDYLKKEKPNLFSNILDLPRSSLHYDQEYSFNSIKKLCFSICNFFSLPPIQFQKLPVIQYNIQYSLPKGNTLFLLGSACSPDTQLQIDDYLKTYHVKNNFCCNRISNVKNATQDNTLQPDAWTQLSKHINSILIEKPCARMSHFNDWLELFLDKNASKILGLIYLPSMYCDSFLYKIPIIRSLCKKSGIPFISIENNYNTYNFNQIRTRLDAFLESIEFKKNCGQLYKKAIISDSGKRDVIDGKFRSMIHAVHGIIPKLPLASIQKVVENQVELFSETIFNYPEKIVWTNMVMSVELLYAFDLIPINIELVAGWLASLGLSRQYIAQSESNGMSSNLCSYFKATLGLIEYGGIPAPKLAVVTSHICDGGPCMADLLKHRYNTEIFVLNIPYNKNKSNVEYVNMQYGRLIHFLEEYTNKKLDENKLASALNRSNESKRYWNMAMDIRKGDPLFEGHLSLRNMFGTTFLFGSEYGVEVAKTYYRELRDAKEKTQRFYESSKYYRILWVHFAPLHNNNIMKFIERELNCIIVTDITGYIYWPDHNIEKPINSLTLKSLSHFYIGEVNKRMEIYNNVINDYMIDGVIHFMHSGCRAIPGSSWLVRNIAKRNHVAYMELAGDCIDPRGFSEGQIKIRMEAFKECLERKKCVLGN